MIELAVGVVRIETNGALVCVHVLGIGVCVLKCLISSLFPSSIALNVTRFP